MQTPISTPCRAVLTAMCVIEIDADASTQYRQVRYLSGASRQAVRDAVTDQHIAEALYAYGAGRIEDIDTARDTLRDGCVHRDARTVGSTHRSLEIASIAGHETERQDITITAALILTFL